MLADNNGMSDCESLGRDMKTSWRPFTIHLESPLVFGFGPLRSMFLEAPKDALTVKVGPGDTAARRALRFFNHFRSHSALVGSCSRIPHISFLQYQAHAVIFRCIEYRAFHVPWIPRSGNGFLDTHRRTFGHIYLSIYLSVCLFLSLCLSMSMSMSIYV